MKSVCFAKSFVCLSLLMLIVAMADSSLKDWALESAVTFATLAGSLLIFRTLDLQQKALATEKSKRKVEHFNTQFFPLLKSQREHARLVEARWDYLDKDGKEKTEIVQNEKAFHAMNEVFLGLMEFLQTYKYSDIYEREIFLTMYNTVNGSIDENVILTPWEEEKMQNSRLDVIRKSQIPYLFSKYGITNEEYDVHSKEDDDHLCAFVLKKIIESQKASLDTYLHITTYLFSYIEKYCPESSNEYINHIKSLLGRDERQFLLMTGILKMK